MCHDESRPGMLPHHSVVSPLGAKGFVDAKPCGNVRVIRCMRLIRSIIVDLVLLGDDPFCLG